MSERQVYYPFDVKTAFLVYDGDENKRQTKDKSFYEWLKAEGFGEARIHTDSCNAYGTWYIDVDTKLFTSASADIMLAPIIGNTGIFIEDFKVIYYIYKRNSTLMKESYHDGFRLKTFDEFREAKVLSEMAWNLRKQIYFDQQPTFEKWCHDVASKIMEDKWYKEHTSIEEILEGMKDKVVERNLRRYFEEKELPAEVAGQWWIITF